MKRKKKKNKKSAIVVEIAKSRQKQLWNQLKQLVWLYDREILYSHNTTLCSRTVYVQKNNSKPICSYNSIR
jgi:hypothetical protein